MLFNVQKIASDPKIQKQIPNFFQHITAIFVVQCLSKGFIKEQPENPLRKTADFFVWRDRFKEGLLCSFPASILELH